MKAWIFLAVLAVLNFTACGVIDGIAEDLGARDNEIQTLDDRVTFLENQLSVKNAEIDVLETKLQNAEDEIDKINYQHEIELKQIEIDALNEQLANIDNNVSA